MNKPNVSGLSVGVISLGCSKNQVDTETMLGLLKQAGFIIVSHPEDADILIVNTCGFITSAKEESIAAILEMAEYKKRRCRTLVVTGCLSERYREELREQLPEVDILLGVREYDKLPEALGRAAGNHADAPRVLTTPFYSGLLRVADGCDNHCSYCAIPLIRGPLRSTPPEALAAEAERMAAAGVTELCVIAQDTTRYGQDLYGKPALPALLERLERIEGLRWIRLLYAYPAAVDEALLALLARSERIVRYLDMPIQHCSDRILRRMNRRGSRKEIETIMARARELDPFFVLRTSIIVGFPGETEQEFEELLAWLREHPFDRLGGFAYSQEEGTPAAALPGQIPEEVKQNRLARLMAQQEEISRGRLARSIGREMEALVEGYDAARAAYAARTVDEAPEVDGKVFCFADQPLAAGRYIRLRIFRADAHDRYGEALT